MTALEAVKLAAVVAAAAVADQDAYDPVHDLDAYAAGLAEGLATAVALVEQAKASGVQPW
jgi:hypothetical protein